MLMLLSIKTIRKNIKLVSQKKSGSIEIATFAGGCFWCVEARFEKKPGIIKAVSGYSGGQDKNPTYGVVSRGRTDHLEAVQVTYDSSKISYEDLLEIFWKSIDPTNPNGQFADRGGQYKTAIFYHNKKQKMLAEESKKRMQSYYDKPIVTKIIPFKKFYEGEEYHQDYASKNPIKYNVYEIGSGRKGFLKKKWKTK